MNQILFVPDSYQEKNKNITSNVRKRRMFIFPLLLGLTVAISSYKIYAVVSNMQEAKNNTYKGAENIRVNSIEVNNDIIVANFNNINNQEEKNNIKNEDNVTNTNEQFQNRRNPFINRRLISDPE